MLSREEIKNKIKSAYWDYDIDPEKLYLIAIEEEGSEVFFTKEKILLRLIERLSWYELIDIFGKEYLSRNLNKALIEKIRNPQIRNKYESIRKILCGETVSPAGWSNQNRKRLKASILFNRWHGS